MCKCLQHWIDSPLGQDGIIVEKEEIGAARRLSTQIVALTKQSIHANEVQPDRQPCTFEDGLLGGLAAIIDQDYLKWHFDGRGQYRLCRLHSELGFVEVQYDDRNDGIYARGQNGIDPSELECIGIWRE